MRALLPIALLLSLSTSAQHITQLNDSVRQEDHLDKKGKVLLSTRYYQGERPVGVWKEYDKKGNLVAERNMDLLRYGKPKEQLPAVTTTTNAPTTDTTGSGMLETMPVFPGGEAELFKYLSTQVHYPAEAVDQDISGTVYIMGVVDESGDWRTVSVLRGAHPYLDYEAWRVTDAMPDWTPGTQKGKPVKVVYNLPIRFMLK